jgi:hypothetical protein
VQARARMRGFMSLSFGRFLVGAHPVRDRGVSALPLRRLFAHWVRSYR